MKHVMQWVVLVSLGLAVGCGGDGHGDHKDHDHKDHGHKDHSHKDHGHKDGDHAGGDDHKHEIHPIGQFDIDGIEVKAAQGHGGVAPGKEIHLEIKLPYNDKGATTVRAWIGTEDRTASSVGKGEYAADHDDYDLHAVAPDPIPAGSKWWVEIEKPDGKKHVGSFKYLEDDHKK